LNAAFGFGFALACDLGAMLLVASNPQAHPSYVWAFAGVAFPLIAATWSAWDADR
jgi:hypothetical protein